MDKMSSTCVEEYFRQKAADIPQRAWLRQFWHYQCYNCQRITVQLRPWVQGWAQVRCPTCGRNWHFHLERGR